MLLSGGFYPWGSWRGALSEMDRLRREMDRLLDSISAQRESPWSGGVFPPVNLREDADKFLLSAELPGVAPEDVEVAVKGKQVSLQGERKAPPLPEDARFHRRERSYATFSRVIGLPAEVDADKVEARLSDGVLRVTLPKAEAARPRRIAVSET